MEASSNCSCSSWSVSIPNTFFKAHEFITHIHTHNCMSNLNICKHCFTKSKFTVQMWLPLMIVILLVHSQCQVDVIYIHLHSTFDIFLHALLFHTLTDYWQSAGYINWFHSYLKNRLSHVHYIWSADIAFQNIIPCPRRIYIKSIAI